MERKITRLTKEPDRLPQRCFTPTSSYRPQSAKVSNASSRISSISKNSCTPEISKIDEYPTICEHSIKKFISKLPKNPNEKKLFESQSKPSDQSDLSKSSRQQSRRPNTSPVSRNSHPKANDDVFTTNPMSYPRRPTSKAQSKRMDLMEILGNNPERVTLKQENIERSKTFAQFTGSLKGDVLPVNGTLEAKSSTRSSKKPCVGVRLGTKSRMLEKDDIKALKEDCQKLETVFENRKSKDFTSKITNVDILNKVRALVSNGGTKPKQHEKIVHYVTSFLRSHPCLLDQVVLIITDSEDFHTSVAAINLLYELLIANNAALSDEDRIGLIKKLGLSNVYKQLVDAMYFVHMRFVCNNDYKADYQNLQCKLLHMIHVLCKTKHQRKQLQSAGDETVHLVGKLVSMNHKNKDLAENLLEVVKVFCIKRNNCNILASKKFFDGLCNCYRLTQKTFTMIVILRKISKYELPLSFMNSNEKLFHVILELISYSGRKVINKPALLTTLFRMSRTDDSLKILSRDELFYKLFHYFMKGNERSDENFRMSAIKAYTLLNRSVNRIILPASALPVDLQLPPDLKRCLEEQKNCEDSDLENESEDDSQDDDDSDDPECNLDFIPSTSTSKRVTNEDEKVQDKEFEESLSYMMPFFSEYLPTNNDNSYYTSTKFDVYQDLDTTDFRIIENRIHRGRFMNKHAFPDAVMLEAESDDNFLDKSINNFSVSHLAHRLKCLRGLKENNYTPRVVYDIDRLYQSFQTLTDIPHPRSYVPIPRFVESQDVILEDNVLKFESRFECGNLRKAIQIEQFEYELFINPDTNTSRGLHWFYFQVSNMICGITYTFNIANCLKSNSQYNHGMQLLMFSVMDYALNKTGWKRVGEGIIYYGNNYINETGNLQYKTLCFSLSFPYANDYVYLAFHYPYTYTRLMLKLFPLLKYLSTEIYTRLDKLCKTASGRNEVALLTITSSRSRRESLGIPFTRRPIIFITARVHPGETNSSWIMEGMIKFLLDERNEDAIKAREFFIFKIIPMLNPEGVIHGNGRKGLTGVDLNRCWAKPHRVTCPEIYNAKRLIACAKKELRMPIAAYIDIHGHSRKRCFFFYGCNPRMSWNKQDKAKEDVLDVLKILPETVQSINSHIRLSQCKYKIEKCREATGRVVMWREFNIKHSFTLECSYSFGNNKQGVNTSVLSEIGAGVIAAFGRITDKAYMSKKVSSSFFLDYVSYEQPVPPTPEKQNTTPATTTTLREEINNARLLLSLSNSILRNSKLQSPRSTTVGVSDKGKPLYIPSRVYHKNVSS